MVEAADPPGGRGQVPGGPRRGDRAQSVSPLQVAAAGGMITAAGLVLAVAAVRPGAPKLSLVLAQLNHAAPVEAAPLGSERLMGLRAPWCCRHGWWLWRSGIWEREPKT